ncbi:MAG: hypothetical protein M3P50_13860, partial [Actinomycetota bacterium]|nr:hypothetical protein [Actinomycetota bacterium]
MRALLHPDRDTVALIDAATGREWSHAALAQEAEALAARLEGERSVVLLRAGLTPETVIAYLGAPAAGHAVIVADEAMAPGGRRRARA